MIRVTNSKEIKNIIRKRVWDLLEKENVALFPKPIYHRIPNFIGADIAASKLASLSIFKEAKIVKINPDSPQRFVRYLAFTQNKIVIMPTPRIRSGFLVLDPSKIPRDKLWEASTISGAYRYGILTKPWDLPKIDLVVVGSVAVNTKGAKLGKGEGYADLEYGILRMLCKISEETFVVTTVHDLQIVNDYIPVESYDVNVDIIVTPKTIIYVDPRPPKPRGIFWDLLSEQKLRDIPILKELKDKLKSVKDISCS
ncbi:MAG: 5-formyltetrahydrofolate cyclo-ligase [Ignisphaera sp.]